MNVYDFTPDLDLSKESRRFYFWGERNRRQ